MTAEDREARLTAYALDDPGLSAADRRELEAQLAADPAARRAVEETRKLSRLLTAGLAAEQAALPAEPSAVTIPAPERTMRTHSSWSKSLVAAAVVVVAVAGSYMAWTKWKQERDPEHRAVAAKAAPGFAQQWGDADEVAGERGGGLAESPSATTAQRLQAELDRNKSEREKMTADGRRADNEKDGKPADGSADKPGYTSPPVSAAPAAKSAPGYKAKAPGRQSGPAGGGPGLGAGGAVPGGSGGPAMGGLLRPGTPGPGGAPGAAVPAGPPAPPGVSAVTPPGTPPPAGEPRPEPRDRGPSKGDPAARPSESPPRADTPDHAEGATRDAHLKLIENPFTRVDGQNALSTFGVDVDTASYSIVRKYLSMGQLPPPSAVRLEEMVNYFPYADKGPEGNDPFAVTVEMADCPWQPKHRLVRLGLKAKPIANDKRPPSNLVFLIDVSGSMNVENRLPLVKASLKLLVSQLGENDRVATVVYAGNSGIVLDSTSALHKDKIVEALDRLEAGGSTNGSGGIHDAYDVATAHFIKNGTNRVILCTDGDWNVGTTSTEALVKLIEDKRKTGVFLSVFGFGMGNLRDEMMVQLAGKGNGNYAYIDSLKEGHKALVEQMGGTLVTVAKDVKIQIEFNPAVVQSYRLLGYEKRALAAKDFHDDTKDAGEMGAGHVVTALYELVPVGVADPAVGKVDGLRYQKADAAPAAKGVKSDEAFVLKMRHKKPDADTSTLRELPVTNRTNEYSKASEDFQFAAAVASFAMLLKDSQYKGDSNYGLVLELAAAARKHDPSGYRAEFIELVKKAKSLAGK